MSDKVADDADNDIAYDNESDIADNNESDAYVPDAEDMVYDEEAYQLVYEGPVLPPDDELQPQPKKKGGRKYKNMNVFENIFLGRLADLTSYLVTSHGDTNVPRNYITEGGIMMSIWLREQREQYNSGEMSEKQINMLVNLNVEFQKQ
jgi:hypothetical protein